MLNRIENALVALILLAALVAAVGSLALGRPVLATIVKSQSMYPLYKRGDIVFLWNWPCTIREGDVIVFKPTEGALAGQWTLHRVVDRDTDGKYLTKGDASEVSDQASGLAGPVTRDSITAKPILIGRLPLKIPWIGVLALNANLAKHGMQRQLLVAVLILMVAVSVYEVYRQSKRRRRQEGVDSRWVFVSIGVTLSLMLAAMTMIQSKRIALAYQVGPDPGVTMGQPLGIILPGEVVEKDLSSLANNGFLPMILLVTEDDPNVVMDASIEMLPPRTERTVRLRVCGNVEGEFKSLVQLSLVFPFLPRFIVGQLAKVCHWYGAISGCALPGLAVAAAGLIDPENRRKTARQIKAIGRRIAWLWSEGTGIVSGSK